jgi:hypothetical protein
MVILRACTTSAGMVRILVCNIPYPNRLVSSSTRVVMPKPSRPSNYIARYNGRSETLAMDMLLAIDRQLC